MNNLNQSRSSGTAVGLSHDAVSSAQVLREPAWMDYGKGKLCLDIIALHPSDSDEDLAEFQGLLERKVAEIKALREWLRLQLNELAGGTQ